MPNASWPPVDEALVEQLALTQRLTLGRPDNIKLTPDGGAVLFTRTGPRSPVAELYEHDVATGRTRALFSPGGADESLAPEEKARRERERKATAGVVGFELSDDGRRLLVPLSGRLYLVDRQSGAATELPVGPTPLDARFDPGGEHIAFVRDGDLHVLDLARGAERRLTTRPSPEIEHGVAEFVAQEEMSRMQGYWWSPDGARLAYQRSDCSGVDLLHVADPARPDLPPVSFRYPRVGRPNVAVSLGVIGAGGGPTVWISWDRERFPYLARVAWSAGGPLTLVVQNRPQTELVVLAADPDSGATTELWREHDDAWLDLDRRTPRWLGDGSAVLWASDRSGRPQLELRGRDGALVRALTSPELGYQTLAGVDEDAAWVVAGPDPRQGHVYRVPLDGSPPRRLTVADGVHDAWPARRGGLAVIRAAGADGEERHELRRADGSVAGALPSLAETPLVPAAVEWLDVEAGGRRHDVAVIRPRAFAAGDRLPVLLHVYGGPTHKHVQLERRQYLEDQIFADAGFVVVRIDGRGTPRRGRDWERAVAGDLITVALADQVAVLQALGARLPELDLGRAAVMGWSFGGYVSAMAALLRPDVFRAAIAGAPVTDWRLYDTHYTERYMGLAEENAAGYEAASALTHAAKLARPLLLIHGTTDDNVYFAHSVRLADALFRARRPFELLPLAGFTHMIPDPDVRKALIARQVDFLRRALS